MTGKCNVDEAVATIIAEGCEVHAIDLLNKSLFEKLEKEYAKTSRLYSSLKAIEKINRLNNNSHDRREGIAALCECKDEE